MATPAFDPDAYLAAPTAFDPDAYLAAPRVSGTPSQKEPPMRGSASGGLIETGLGAVTGLGSSIVGGLAGIAGTLIPGERGQGARVSRYIQEKMTYQPRTQQGQAMTTALALPFELATEGAGRLGEVIGGPAAGRTIGEAVPAVASTLLPVPKMLTAAKARGTQQAARQMETNIALSYENAPQIEAAQTAQRLNIALPPSISNPTKTTRAISAVAGREGDKVLGEGNVKQIVKLVKQDLGDTSPDPRISLATIDKALDIASAPYEPVRALPALRVPYESSKALLMIPRESPLISGKKGAAAVKELVDETLTALSEGRSGRLVLDDIRKLRSDAQDIFKTNDKGINPPDPVATERANAGMKIANTLEDILDANAAPEVVPALRAARIKLRQIYDHERAIDYVTGAIDPQMYAKLLQERKGQMTGLPADIGKVAAIYPSVMAVTPATSFVAPRLVRGGMGATAGAVIGSTLGPLGTAAGLVAGTAGGALVGNLAARRMASPAFQAKYAVPTDYRPRQPVNNLPVPFDPRNALADPNTPNWAYGTGGIEQDLRVGVPSTPQLPPPSLGANAAAVDMKRQYELARDRAAGTLAEQRAAEAEAAQRVPTGTGQVYDIDPITGRLKSASEGLKGATPDTITSTGHTLASAVEKLSGQPTLTTATKYIRVDTGKVDAQGAPIYRVQKQSTKVTPGEQANQAFALSAEERIAWNKTKIDLASVAPEFNKLSDKAIAERMMDRQWVSNAVTKAREQARGFDEIAQRAETAANSRAASIQRDRLMDLAEALDERLSIMPSVKPKAQGPKTRAAQRNALRGDDENQNRLAPQ